MISSTELKSLEDSLLNTSGNIALHTRFRALFTLKSLKNEEAVRIISTGLQDSSALLKHELAYCLGQMKLESALPALEKTLRDTTEDPMVRHEAAEAMGAISASGSVPILQEFVSDPERSVRETCEIAIAKIQWDNSEEGKKHWSSLKDDTIPLYTSIDPAPATSGLLSGAPRPDDISPAKVAEIQSRLLDTSLSLFERYRAMFALRNIGTPAAVDALASGFTDSSALFKHEIAFIFGQLLSPHSIPSLLQVLRDDNESEMVRHEAAEALGGIGTPEVLPHLREWMDREDAPRVVRESCQIAIDMWEHENSGEFHYLAGLNTPIDSEKSTHYFHKALSYVPKTLKEVDLHASAHALLLESRSFIPRAGRKQPEPIELIFEVGEPHAWKAVSLRPNAPLPPIIVDYCHSYRRLRRETNVMVLDGLWERFAQFETEEDLAREVKRGAMKKSDKGKALMKCSGKCDAKDKPHYCSAQCQKKHWKVHKPHCKPNGGRPAHESLRVPGPDFDFEVGTQPGLWKERGDATSAVPVIQTFLSQQGKSYRVKGPKALLDQIDWLPVPDSTTGDILPLADMRNSSHSKP
ncbi:hypothetical protein DXG01_011968 [Tephrocybe rancida]|nr:hypothetical protein DXG01_011968 [Tephrocybe rancida]